MSSINKIKYKFRLLNLEDDLEIPRKETISMKKKAEIKKFLIPSKTELVVEFSL